MSLSTLSFSLSPCPSIVASSQRSPSFMRGSIFLPVPRRAVHVSCKHRQISVGFLLGPACKLQLAGTGKSHTKNTLKTSQWAACRDLPEIFQGVLSGVFLCLPVILQWGLLTGSCRKPTEIFSEFWVWVFQCLPVILHWGHSKEQRTLCKHLSRLPVGTCLYSTAGRHCKIPHKERTENTSGGCPQAYILQTSLQYDWQTLENPNPKHWTKLTGLPAGAVNKHHCNTTGRH